MAFASSISSATERDRLSPRARVVAQKVQCSSQPSWIFRRARERDVECRGAECASTRTDPVIPAARNTTSGSAFATTARTDGNAAIEPSSSAAAQPITIVSAVPLLATWRTKRRSLTSLSFVTVQELMTAGAAAYVLKQSSSATLLNAIRAAAAGGRFLDPALPPPEYPRDPRRRAETPPVTDRETEVLRLMAIGHSNKDIAAALNISVKTVEVHKANAMRKLNLRGRTDVVRYAVMNEWLKDP